VSLPIALAVSREEILEPGRRQLGVADRMPDVLVAEISLDRSSILAGVGQRVARSMPEHVRVGLERQPGLLTGPLRHSVETVAIEWRPALIEGRFRVLLLLQGCSFARLAKARLMNQICKGCAPPFFLQL